MTVLSVQDSFSQYTGTGDRTFYEYGFEWNGEPVNVRVDGRPATYTQQANGIVFDVAPALGVEIIIARETPLTQETDFRVFGPFDAAKTEDAMDKLILLKQESFAYRAKVNLYADQQLAYTDLVNDTGTTPRITLWNEEQSGVFSGEVTMMMPEAGSFVEKPEDFVYFQYGDTPILTEELTTTLYPLEATEQATFGISMGSASMGPIPIDQVNFTGTIAGVTMEVALLDDGPYDDDVNFTGTIVSVEMLDILLSDGPYDDVVNFSGLLTGVEMLEKLVSVFSPVEEVAAFSCTMVTANCSMTPI